MRWSIPQKPVQDAAVHGVDGQDGHAVEEPPGHGHIPGAHLPVVDHIAREVPHGQQVIVVAVLDLDPHIGELDGRDLVGDGVALVAIDAHEHLPLEDLHDPLEGEQRHILVLHGEHREGAVPLEADHLPLVQGAKDLLLLQIPGEGDPRRLPPRVGAVHGGIGVHGDALVDGQQGEVLVAAVKAGLHLVAHPGVLVRVVDVLGDHLGAAQRVGKVCGVLQVPFLLFIPRSPGAVHPAVKGGVAARTASKVGVAGNHAEASLPVADADAALDGVGKAAGPGLAGPIILGVGVPEPLGVGVKVLLQVLPQLVVVRLRAVGLLVQGFDPLLIVFHHQLVIRPLAVAGAEIGPVPQQDLGDPLRRLFRLVAHPAPEHGHLADVGHLHHGVHLNIQLRPYRRAVEAVLNRFRGPHGGPQGVLLRCGCGFNGFMRSNFRRLLFLRVDGDLIGGCRCGADLLLQGPLVLVDHHLLRGRGQAAGEY